MTMFLLQCPRCGKEMKYQPLRGGIDVSGKVKKCVYCNFSMNVQKSLVRRV